MIKRQIVFLLILRPFLLPVLFSGWLISRIRPSIMPLCGPDPLRYWSDQPRCEAGQECGIYIVHKGIKVIVKVNMLGVNITCRNNLLFIRHQKTFFWIFTILVNLYNLFGVNITTMAWCSKYLLVIHIA